MLPCERAYVWGAKVAPDLRGCPPGEGIRMHAILKENTTNCISLERLINVDFEKKSQLPVFPIPQKKIPATLWFRNIYGIFRPNFTEIC